MTDSYIEEDYMDGDELRLDGIVSNALLKLGTKKDVESHHRPSRLSKVRFSDDVLEDLYAQDPIAQRVCEFIPARIMRTGVEVIGVQKEPTKIELIELDILKSRFSELRKDVLKKAEKTGKIEANDYRALRGALDAIDKIKNKYKSNTIQRHIRRSGIIKSLYKASIMAAIYWRGAGVILDIDDGKGWWDPVDVDNIRSVSIAFTADGRYIQPIYAGAFSDSPSYFNIAGLIQAGELENELKSIEPTEWGKGIPQQGINEPEGDDKKKIGQASAVHPSRVLWIDGIYTPPRLLQRLQGSISRLQLFWKSYARYEASLTAAANILHRMEVLNIKREGLLKLLAKSDDEAEAALFKELETLIYSLHTLGIAFSDKDKHAIEVISRQLTGIKDIIIENKRAAIAASGLTEMALFGLTTAGAGLANQDLRDRMQIADIVEDRAESEWREPLETYLLYVFNSQDGPTKGDEPDDWQAVFPSALKLTPQEESELRSEQATTDKTYIETGTLDPREARESRFGSGRWSPETTLNPDYEPDPEQAPPMGQPGQPGTSRQPVQGDKDLKKKLEDITAMVENLEANSRSDSAPSPYDRVEIHTGPDESKTGVFMEQGYDLVICDADGTLRESPNMYPRHVADWKLKPNVKEFFGRIPLGAVQLAIASNQGGVELDEVDEGSAMAALMMTYQAIGGNVQENRDYILMAPTLNEADPDRKPNPGILNQLIAQRMSDTSQVSVKAVMVGDSETDKRAAFNAGIDFIWAADLFGWNARTDSDDILSPSDWLTMAEFSEDEKAEADELWSD